MFNSTTLSMYIMTLGVAALIPGPGMTALLFKSLTYRYRIGLIMLLGLITGDLFYLAIALFGLHYLEGFINSTFSIILIVGTCIYLYYIAIKLWLNKDDILGAEQTKNNNTEKNPFIAHYFNGFILTLSNPKMITFYLALVPSIFGTNLKISYSALLVIIALTISILLCVGGIYIFSAHQLKSLLSNPNDQHILLKMLSMFMASLATYIMVNQIFPYY